MPATQSAPSACWALAPMPDESMRKFDVGLQSSKCHWPKPPTFSPTPPSPKTTPLSGGKTPLLLLLPPPPLLPPMPVPELEPVTPLLDPPKPPPLVGPPPPTGAAPLVAGGDAAARPTLSAVRLDDPADDRAVGHEPRPADDAFGRPDDDVVDGRRVLVGRDCGEATVRRLPRTAAARREDRSARGEDGG